jgi:O-antigen/teichoic acid export membrane protein
MLVCGDFVSNVAGLISVSITVRSLGAASFGILVLIQAYADLIGELFALQSWQATTRHGEEALAANRRDRLANIVRFGFRLDLVASSAGAVFTAVSIWLFALWQAWPASITSVACFYSLTELCRVSSTPISVFNLFGRYGTFSRHAASTGVLRLALFVTVATLHPTLEGFAVAGCLAAVAAQLVQLALARRILIEEKVPLSLPALVHPRPTRLDPALRRSFLLSTIQSSLSGTLTLVSTHLVTLAVGLLLGTVAAAQFRVIQMVGNVLTRLTRPVVQSTYPEFVAASRRADFVATRKLIRAIDRAVLGLAALAAGGFLVVGRAAIGVCFGPDFAPIFWPLLAFLLAAFWGVSNRTIVPRLWAVDGHRAALAAQAVAATVHLAALTAGGWLFGIPGVVASFFLFHAVFRHLGTRLLRDREQLRGSSQALPRQAAIEGAKRPLPVDTAAAA